MEKKTSFNLHINERLEKQKVNELFAKRKESQPKNEEEKTEMLNNIITELVMNTTFITLAKTKEAKDGSLQITFQMVKSNDGLNYFPLFTSSEDLELWDAAKGAQTVQIGFDYFAQMLEVYKNASGVVFNPFSDNLRVEKKLVEQWFRQKQIRVQGHARHTITKDTKYEFYAPTPYPFDISDKLAEKAKELEVVKRVWLRGVKLDETDGYAAIVEADGKESEVNDALRILGESCKGMLKKPIHLVPYASDFGKDGTKDVVPIYAK